MRIETLVRLNRTRAERKGAVLLTRLSTGEVELVLEEEMKDRPLSAEIGTALRSGKAATVETADGAVFINPYVPPPRIVVIGAVHISQALAPIARIAGYDLTIIDPRTAFATPERFDGVRLLTDWPEEVLAGEPFDSYTAVAVVTHDPKIDDFPLSAALTANCFYVGALGSRKTHGKRLERLKALGHDDDELCRIAAPIGLDIGAASPAEIAVAIMAQIIEAFRRRHRPETSSR
ncbi:XdhC family protein [Neorhizobium sp. NCHU2750]|uniref:XdhC family protein n=1 Tax=Neorhizobium sp. NCHU2750 TaxID=1825976 RepID=UPI000E75F9A3|nr:xanthine dehydrogenase accessory factor [Neorhizobium sp. NCHU2750]